MNLVCYLAGPMEYASDGGVKWREKVIKDAGHIFEFINPCTMERTIVGVPQTQEELSKLKISNLPLYCDVLKNIINRDVWEIIINSDIILANLDTKMGGTTAELTLAYLLGIPVIAIVDKDKVLDISGWAMGCCDKIVDSVDDAIGYLLHSNISTMCDKKKKTLKRVFKKYLTGGKDV